MYELLHSPTRWAHAAKSFRGASSVAHRSQRQASPEPTPPLPPRLTLLDQWNRLAAVLIEAQDRAQRVIDCQRRAAGQLDAATYGLQRLRDEVAPAMILTRPRTASAAPVATAFKRDQFRRREPIAA